MTKEHVKANQETGVAVLTQTAVEAIVSTPSRQSGLLSQEVEDVLGDYKAKDQKEIKNRLEAIKRNAEDLNKSKSAKGLIDKVFSIFKDTAQDYLKKNQSLNELIKETTDLIDEKNTLHQKRLPQIEKISVAIRNNVEEIQKNKLIIKKLEEMFTQQLVTLQEKYQEADVNDQFTLNMDLMSTKDSLDALRGAKDDLVQAETFYSLQASLIDNARKTTRTVLQGLKSTKDIIVPMLKLSAMTSAVVSEQKDTVDLIKAVKDSTEKTTIDAMKQSADIKIQIAQQKAKGIIGVDVLEEAIGYLAKAEEEVAKLEKEYVEQAEKRELIMDKYRDGFMESITKIAPIEKLDKLSASQKRIEQSVSNISETTMNKEPILEYEAENVSENQETIDLNKKFDEIFNK